MAAALVAAFSDDPLFCWILPDEEQRATVMRGFFALVVDIAGAHDDSWTTQDGTTGAALWVPHGAEVMPAEVAQRFTAEVARLSGPNAERMLGVLELTEQQHPRAPHEFLFFVGVRPRAQGHGVGSALLDPVLARADAAGHPCYLEASSPRSRALYERHGFRVVGEFGLAGAPPMWPMVRDPQPLSR